MTTAVPEYSITSAAVAGVLPITYQCTVAFDAELWSHLESRVGFHMTRTERTCRTGAVPGLPSRVCWEARSTATSVVSPPAAWEAYAAANGSEKVWCIRF